MRLVKPLVHCGLTVLVAVTVTRAIIGVAHTWGQGAAAGAILSLVAFWVVLKYTAKT